MSKSIKNRVLFPIMLLAVLALVGIIFMPTGFVSAAASVPNSSADVAAVSYDLTDNTGYVLTDSRKNQYPLGGAYATVSVDVLTGGEVSQQGSKGGYDAYGIVAGGGAAQDGKVVTINLKYNYNTTTGINGTDWQISGDSAESVNGVTVGVINSGALIVSKSYDGANWTWQNTVDGGLSSNFHTTDFTYYFSPSTYNGDNKVEIYTPSGEDIAKGVYIKVIFAYELKYERVWYENNLLTWLTGKQDRKTEWIYKNVLEQSVFYLANNSAEVAFRNASTENGATDAETSEIVLAASTIKSGHGTLSGFRLNKLNNDSFDVQYRLLKPNGTLSNWATAQDEQFFPETGRYDFRVTTVFGKVREYSIYVNTLDVNGAVNLYFGNPPNITENSLITTNSHRVFSTVDTVPVYVAGQTFYKINAVNQAYMPVAGTIRNTDTGEEIVVDASYSQKTGTLTEAGNYIAEFYSNPDYEGELSGDAYHFVFKFIVIPQDETPGPIVNQELLNGLIGFSDLKSGYYGVTLDSAGTGKLTYAFADYSSAYSFAYKYERGLVVAVDGGYLYKNPNNPEQQSFYSSQFDVLDAVDQIVAKKVIRSYFDASNLDSYTTLSEFTYDALSLNLSRDVIVFADENEQEILKSGEPFLNDRPYRYVDENGEIQTGIYEFKFIRVANFESNTVRLIHEETGKGYNIVYDVSVQRQLEWEGAPSGRYKIIETTLGGDSVEYYAVYIRRGDITSSLTVEKFVGGNIVSQTLSKENNLLRQTVNGFILKSALNQYDPHTIVKITKDGELVRICEIDEISGLVFDEEGEYVITLVDRLGNSCEFIFNIYYAIPAHTVSYETADGSIMAQTVFVGQTIELPTPVVEDEYYEFIGWIYNGGIITDGNFTLTENADVTLVERVDKVFVLLTFDSNGGSAANSIKARVGTTIDLPTSTMQGYVLGGWEANGVKYKDTLFIADSTDLDFTAVWHYPQVNISLYDGDLYTIYTLNPDDRQVLPLLSKSGYTLFGWYYTEANGNGRFYVGQITSVPNVTDMRLDAVWKKTVEAIDAPMGNAGQAAITLVNGNVINTLYVNYGATAQLPTLTAAEGLEFFGWQYQSAALSGTIYTGGSISSVPSESQIILYAIWKTAPTTGTNTTGTAIGTIGGGASSGLNGFFESLYSSETATSFSSIIAFALLTAFIAFLYFKKQRESNLSFNSIFDTKIAEAYNSYELTKQSANSSTEKKKRTNSGVQFFKPGFFAKRVVPAMSLVLVVVLTGIVVLQRLPAGTFSSDNEGATADISATYNQTSTTPLVQNYSDGSKKDFTLKSGLSFSEYFSAASVAADGDGDNGNFAATSVDASTIDMLNLSDEEAFLFALIMIDMLSVGYDVFPAYAQKIDNTRVYGLAYSYYDEAYNLDAILGEQIYDSEINGRLFIGAGFVPFLEQDSITEQDAENGIVIIPTTEEYDYATAKYAFVLSISQNIEENHYVAFDKYVVYSINDLSVQHSKVENMPNNYRAELGIVYSYDLNRIVFDPDIGTQQTLSATTLNTSSDYVLVRDAFRSYIEQQNANGLAVDTVTTSYISMAAINEWMMYGQYESFLGLSPEEIELFESQLGEREYYYVDADGNLHAANFPEPTPEAPSFWQRFALWSMAIATIAVGVVVSVAVTVVTCGAAATAMTIVSGAMMGAGIEMLMQAIQGKGINQVNWLKVGVAAVSGALAAIPGIGWIGAGLVSGGTQAAMTAIDGGSWEDIAKSFAIGFATGVLIHGATKLLSKASSKIADKLGKCFVAGTAVLAVVGGVAVFRNIEDIRVGDYVYTYNVTTGQNEVQQVTDTLTSVHMELIKVSTSDGQTISSSFNHPYYTQRGWIEAQDLRAGDILRTVNGKKVIVELVQHEILEQPQTLYNFEVTGNNNYFVAQNISIENNQFVLVHNFCKANSNAVIGKLKDVQDDVIGKNEHNLLKHMQKDLGSPKLNWKQNSSVLRREMSKGLPIRDASAYDFVGTNTGFLRAERNLLQSKGWELIEGWWRIIS